MNTNTNTDPTVKSKRPDSCCFVLFGVTGDLAHRLVIPALYNLAEADLLPERFCVVGVARSEVPTQTLHNDLMAALNQYATRPVNQSIANKLFECITSISADPSEPHSFERLKTELDSVCERDIRNHLYYLAVPPAAFKPISEALASVGLLREPKGGMAAVGRGEAVRHRPRFGECLVIGIEPTEGVTLQFNTKVPGPRVIIDGVKMKFNYQDYFRVAPSTGYETLIYDCMIGDNILFQRADSVEAGWQSVQPFLEAWQKGGRGIHEYTAGSEGPSAADDLIQRDDRRWRSLEGD